MTTATIEITTTSSIIETPALDVGQRPPNIVPRWTYLATVHMTYSIFMAAGHASNPYFGAPLGSTALPLTPIVNSRSSPWSRNKRTEAANGPKPIGRTVQGIFVTPRAAMINGSSNFTRKVQLSCCQQNPHPTTRTGTWL